MSSTDETLLEFRNQFDALVKDMRLLVQRQTEMQQQFMYVSGQAYLALEMLKKRGICTPEEVEEEWQKIAEKVEKTDK